MKLIEIFKNCCMFFCFGGYLFLLENIVVGDVLYIEFIFGIFLGWWFGVDDVWFFLLLISEVRWYDVLL